MGLEQKVSPYYDPRFNTSNDRVWLEVFPKSYSVDGGHGKSWKKRQSTSRKGRRKSQQLKKQRERLSQRDGGWWCHWCNCPLSVEAPMRQWERWDEDGNQFVQYPTVDHVIEYSISQDNSDENCVLSCQPCNNTRSRKHSHAMNKIKNPSPEAPVQQTRTHLTFRLEIPDFPVAKPDSEQ